MKTLGRMTSAKYTRVVYKFVDGKMVEKFESLDKAANHAGISYSGLSTYMLGKLKKPRKIAANVEYSYKPVLTKSTAPSSED